MHEIKNITQDKYNFYILRDDHVLAVQRKYIFDATHSSLTSDEELINALCRKLLPSNITGGG